MKLVWWLIVQLSNFMLNKTLTFLWFKIYLFYRHEDIWLASGNFESIFSIYYFLLIINNNNNKILVNQQITG